jgi:Ca2+/Na+ antiporter
MNKLFLKHLIFTATLFLLSPFLWAQTGAPPIDQTMRSHDKIYVVMAVCIVILIVFFLYLIRIDRKVSKKEKSVK